MDSDNEMTIVFMSSILLALAVALHKQKRRKVRHSNIRNINKNRNEKGFYHGIFIPMKQDAQQFFKYTRMDLQTFNKLVTLLEPLLKKHIKQLPNNIYEEERVALTLHYLSQGSSMQTIAWKYHMGISTVHLIIQEVCCAIWVALAPCYLKAPNCNAEWFSISEEFMSVWNFPNCIGSIDGKHIQIKAPANSGSQFFNYKKNFSIVLMAACDAQYHFTLVDIGAYGSQSDGGVFKNSAFGSAILNNKMNIPSSKSLPGTNVIFPHVFVADEAFPLTSFIMRPYPGRLLSNEKRIFNYRLSRARRVIENAFGILSARWRILLTTINATVENAEYIVKATVCLHNFVKKENTNQTYIPPGYTDSNDNENGNWRSEEGFLQSVGRLSSNVSPKTIVQQRDHLKDYFLSDVGKVSWQNERVFGI